MRISDWSSDVCSSDLLAADRLYTPGVAAVEDLLAHQQALGLERMVIVQPTPYGADNRCTLEAARSLRGRARAVAVVGQGINTQDLPWMHSIRVRGQIGRASCRGSVCQYV